MKKIIYAAVVAFLGATTVFAAIGFPDVSVTDWFYDASNFAQDHNYINGIGGRFEPGRTVTRDQAAVMFYKFASNVRLTAGDRVFHDTWYGFELTFPAAWNGYLYEYNYSQDRAPSSPLATYRFGLNDFNNTYRELMVLSIYERGTWAVISEEAVNQQLVSQNASYAVTVSPAQSVRVELQAAHGLIDSIMDTFRWAVAS